jgi:hypothetical protein
MAVNVAVNLPRQYDVQTDVEPLPQAGLSGCFRDVRNHHRAPIRRRAPLTQHTHHHDSSTTWYASYYDIDTR